MATKYVQFVMGPAGAGKSTYCQVMKEYCENIGRSVHVLNLDPAAEVFHYEPSIDIRELVTVDDVMEAYEIGPNGGLVYSLEYMSKEMEWLKEQIGEYEEDYLLVDCPGQIELYTHLPVMKSYLDFFKDEGYFVCIVFLIDAQYINETTKFISGMCPCIAGMAHPAAALMTLSVMINFEVPHINVMTKMDLLGAKADSEEIDKFLDADVDTLLLDLNKNTPKKLVDLNVSVAGLLNSFGMVSFLPLNINEDHSIDFILGHIDTATQYGEGLEPREPQDFDNSDLADDYGDDGFVDRGTGGMNDMD